jgi:hypothetical protein
MENRGTRFTLTDLPEEWETYCCSRRPDLKPYEVWEDFRDYWKAKTGQNATKLDWQATWQTWVRNTRRKPVFAPEPPKRSYPQSKPIQAGRADSAAYREFRDRMTKLKPASRSVGTFVSLGEVVTLRPGAGLPETCEPQFHRDAEWMSERAAIQHEGDPV